MREGWSGKNIYRELDKLEKEATISSHLISFGSHLALIIDREMVIVMLRSLRYSWVARFLALLLLAAAGLKLNGLAVDPVSRMGLFSVTAFQVAVIEFEIFLALWLLSGKRLLGSWATTLSVFAVFAGVSAYQGWIGRASCGCFGKFSVSPWYAFGLDVAIVFTLILSRPDLTAVRQKPRLILTDLLPAVYGLVGAFAVLLMLVALISWFIGSPDAVLARLRGERVSLYPRMVDVGTGAADEMREAAFWASCDG